MLLSEKEFTANKIASCSSQNHCEEPGQRDERSPFAGGEKIKWRNQNPCEENETVRVIAKPSVAALSIRDNPPCNHERQQPSRGECCQSEEACAMLVMQGFAYSPCKKVKPESADTHGAIMREAQPMSGKFIQVACQFTSRK